MTPNSDENEANFDEETSTSTGKRLTEAEFQNACDIYEKGERSLVEIAKDLGISRQALSKRFKSAGIVKGSRAAEVAAAGHKAAVAAAESYSDNRAKWIEETRLIAVNVLKQSLLLARHTVVENLKSKRPPSAIDPDLKALNRYNRIIIDNVEATLRVLKADEHVDENKLPKLTVEDLTDEDLLKHHKEIGALPLDATTDDLVAEIKSYEEKNDVVGAK